MSAYSGRDFARSFRTVRKNTLQTAKDIPEDKWTFRASPDTRSVGQLLAHIAALTYWPLRAHTVDRKTFMTFEDFGRYIGEATTYEKTLTSRADILRSLEVDGEEFAKALDALTDADLAEHVGFPPPLDPPSKSRFEMLLGVKEHEMHHRAQLMVLQRLVGLVPHLTREREARAQAATR